MIVLKEFGTANQLFGTDCFHFFVKEALISE